MSNEKWEGGQEVQSSWFKFVTVGDKIKGTLINKQLQKGQNNFPDQWVYELLLEDGAVMNVPISVNKAGTIARLRNVKLGQIIGFEYEKDIPSKGKGFAPAKAIKVWTWGMDPNYDINMGGVSHEVGADEVDFN